MQQVNSSQGRLQMISSEIRTAT